MFKSWRERDVKEEREAVVDTKVNSQLSLNFLSFLDPNKSQIQKTFALA